MSESVVYHVANSDVDRYRCLTYDLRPFVTVAGELLPLRIARSDEPAHLLNVLRVFDVVDPATGDDFGMRTAFIEHRLPESGLFRVPEHLSAIFYVERDDDEASFRSRIEEHQLSGVRLVRIWSTSTGPSPVNIFVQ